MNDLTLEPMLLTSGVRVSSLVHAFALRGQKDAEGLG
jgi:hypothetical protein